MSSFNFMHKEKKPQIIGYRVRPPFAYHRFLLPATPGPSCTLPVESVIYRTLCRRQFALIRSLRVSMATAKSIPERQVVVTWRPSPPSQAARCHGNVRYLGYPFFYRHLPWTRLLRCLCHSYIFSGHRCHGVVIRYRDNGLFQDIDIRWRYGKTE